MIETLEPIQVSTVVLMISLSAVRIQVESHTAFSYHVSLVLFSLECFPLKAYSSIIYKCQDMETI